jgi:ribosomal protein S18 acetylase RimI-like enzyme
MTLPDDVLADIERYYDAVPRPLTTAEEVGPFTLFLPDPGTGWTFYARPRLGGGDAFTAEDVRRLIARQDELGAPRNLEWVHETTPTLLAAAQEATSGMPGVDLGEYPLLVLPAHVEVPDAPDVRILGADDPDLGRSNDVVHAAFGGSDQVVERPLGRRPQLVRDGILVVAAAYVDGQVAGGGTSAPRGNGAELMGIAVPPRFRRRGLGSALTRGLVNAVRERGARVVLLSAASDDAASIYRQVGFVDVGTACILEISRD